MFRFWYPPGRQFHKPMVLVEYEAEQMQHDRIKAYIERAKPIEEILAFKNGRVTGRYYYRIIYGYHALGKDKT